MVSGECEHAEHTVAHHLRRAADPDMAPAEFVLEAAIDTLSGRALVVANVLRKLEAKHLSAPGFRVAWLCCNFGQRRLVT